MGIIAHISFVLLICSVWSQTAQTKINKIDRGGSTLEVFAGGKAEITCRYTYTGKPDIEMITWQVIPKEGDSFLIYYSDPIREIIEKNTGYSDRISVESYNGGVTLNIRQVRLSDERKFNLEITDRERIHYCGHYLKVYAVPEQPGIEGVQFVSLPSESLTRIASCESRGGYPAPNFSWFRNNVMIHSDDKMARVETNVTQESNGGFTVKSVLLRKVTREDKDAHYFCELNYSVPGDFETIRSASVGVTVHYPTTSLDLWKEKPTAPVTEGDTVQMRCRGDGNPPTPVHFRKQGSDEELESHGGLLVLRNVTRNHSGVYECHSHGPDPLITSLPLTVHYLDPAVTVPKDMVVVLRGDSLNLTCHAPSSLETSTVWIKDGREVGTADILRLDNVTFDTAGQYDCEVTVPSAPGRQTSASVRVSVRGAPETTGAEREIEMEEMEKARGWVNLSCEVRGHPTPAVTWSITGSQGWREVATNVTGDRVQSVVMLQVSMDTVAVCSSTNDYGANTQTYDLRSAQAPINVRMEDNVDVYMGESAEIPCLFNFTKKPEFWRVEYFVGEDRIVSIDPDTQKVEENTSYSERISVEAHDGGVTLTLHQVQLSDEREFTCKVTGFSGGNGQNKTLLKVSRTFLPVIVPVDYVELIPISVLALLLIIIIGVLYSACCRSRTPDRKREKSNQEEIEMKEIQPEEPVTMTDSNMEPEPSTEQ